MSADELTFSTSTVCPGVSTCVATIRTSAVYINVLTNLQASRAYAIHPAYVCTSGMTNYAELVFKDMSTRGLALNAYALYPFVNTMKLTDRTAIVYPIMRTSSMTYSTASVNPAMRTGLLANRTSSVDPIMRTGG